MSVKVTYNTSSINERLENASKSALSYIGRELLKDERPYIPKDTGALRRSGKIQSVDTSNNKVNLTWTAPYASDVYEGILYTPTGARQMHFHTPGTQDHWDEPFKEGGEARDEFVEKVKQYLIERMNNGNS